MQDCLGPAHGMHTVMKPDPMTLGYPSKEEDTFFRATKGLPHSGDGASWSNLSCCE